MQKTRDITLGRVRAFLSTQQIQRHLYQEQHEIMTVHVYHAPGRVSYKEATAAESQYTAVTSGEELSPIWSTHWFRLKFEVPEVGQSWR